MSKEELFELTNIDPWWLAQMEELHQTGALTWGNIRVALAQYHIIPFQRKQSITDWTYAICHGGKKWSLCHIPMVVLPASVCPSYGIVCFYRVCISCHHRAGSTSLRKQSNHPWTKTLCPAPAVPLKTATAATFAAVAAVRELAA